MLGEKTAEFCSKYFKKGLQVGLVGRIQTRNWDDDNGQKHFATEVIAEEVYFADSKREDNDSNSAFTGNTFTDFEGDDLPF